jgi:hypothetical protein
VDIFLPPPGRIVFFPLNDTHKNEIKHRILMFHYIDQQCLIFVIHVDPTDSTKILETRPRNWFTLSSLMFFYYGWTTYNLGCEGKFHIIVSCC